MLLETKVQTELQRRLVANRQRLMLQLKEKHLLTLEILPASRFCRCTRRSAVGSRAFSVLGLSAWNDLPLPLEQKPSLDSFRSSLKTFFL